MLAAHASGATGREEMARAPDGVEARKRLDWRASFARVEPVLQGAGFLYTFVILYVLLNVFLFVHGAAPEWRKAIALRRRLTTIATAKTTAIIIRKTRRLAVNELPHINNIRDKVKQKPIELP